MAPTLWDKSHQKNIVQQKNPKRENEVIQKSIICSQDDSHLQERHEEETDYPGPPRQPEHPRHQQFQAKSYKRGSLVEPMRKLVRVPANPRRQWAILVVLVHGAQIAPGRIAAKIFRDPGFEVNREPQKPQQKERGPRRRLLLSQTWSPAAWREKITDKPRAKQHAIRLIAGKILCCRDKREEANET